MKLSRRPFLPAIITEPLSPWEDFEEIESGPDARLRTREAVESPLERWSGDWLVADDFDVYMIVEGELVGSLSWPWVRRWNPASGVGGDSVAWVTAIRANIRGRSGFRPVVDMAAYLARHAGVRDPEPCFELCLDRGFTGASVVELERSLRSRRILGFPKSSGALLQCATAILTASPDALGYEISRTVKVLKSWKIPGAPVEFRGSAMKSPIDPVLREYLIERG